MTATAGNTAVHLAWPTPGSGGVRAHRLRRVAEHERRCRSAPRRITPAARNLVRRHLPDQWQDVLLQGHRGERDRQHRLRRGECDSSRTGWRGGSDRRVRTQLDQFPSTGSASRAALPNRSCRWAARSLRTRRRSPTAPEPRSSCAVRMAASGGSASSAALRRAGCHSAASSPQIRLPTRPGRRSACSCSGATRRSTGNESRARWRAARAGLRVAWRHRHVHAGHGLDRRDQVRRRAGHDGRRVLPTVLGSSPTGGWQSLGGYITSDPSVTSDNFGGGGVTVFARGADLSEFSQHVSSAGAASSWVALGRKRHVDRRGGVRRREHLRVRARR